MRRLAVLAVLLPALAASAAPGRALEHGTSCAPLARAGVPARAIEAALRSGRDVWGERLLRSPAGPTYAAARQYLSPLLFARAAGRTPLTESGVHYLPFGTPSGARGATQVALHVADGSEIVARRAGGRSFTVGVGSDGRERYGSCLRRLGAPRLAEGWLPVLETSYVDAGGVRYRQESFSTRAGGVLTSFVQLEVVAGSRGGATVRLGGDVALRLRSGRAVLHRAWAADGRSAPRPVTPERYDAERGRLTAYWRGRVAEGMAVDVPERRVSDAAKALLVQGLTMTWRYSVGNQYEQLSFPEAVDVAQVLGELGHEAVARQILRTALARPDTAYPSWKMGEKLLGAATHFRHYRDRAFVGEQTPRLRRYVSTLGRQIDRSEDGLLAPERYSSDIKEPVVGLHSQAVVWAGLRGMAAAWQSTGRTALAAESRRLAARLEGGLRAAVRQSQRQLPDGSLFVPVQLLGGEAPYRSLIEARLGSYWNLVMPYALASGLFAPRSAEADGIWRYMQLHGSRLLGLVRAGAYALYGREASFPTSGTDQVYGINVSRFLGDRADADELVLSLYGQLAAGMTPGTYAAGEAASVSPIPGQPARAMYLPPSGAANAAFLETLRQLLVHDGVDGVVLAPATPRAWLAPGKRIAVENAPTRFGPVSFELRTHARHADVVVTPPRRSQPRTLRLMLRLPPGTRIASVTRDGRPYGRFDAAAGTIDLSGRRGTVQLRVGFRKSVA